MRSLFSFFGLIAASCLFFVLILPIFALANGADLASLRSGWEHPQFVQALLLSLKSTTISILCIIAGGTPLAWWLASTKNRLSQLISLLVDLPIVIPPAVLGVGLLAAFGRKGLLGPWLDSWGVSLAFSTTAVILAQVVVSAPFYIQAASSVFAQLDRELLIVAETLGASKARVFFSVILPICLPGLIAGTSLAWARALGEFGATLLFAGNMPGRTQTLPLAIFSALESNVQTALVFSLSLAAMGGFLLAVLRFTPQLWSKLFRQAPR